MKLLLIRNDNIGDLACTTPLLELLHSSFPKARIDFLGNSYNVDLVRHDPRFTRLWFYEKAKHVCGAWKKLCALLNKLLVLAQLRMEHYDAVIIAVPIFNKRTSRLACWINPKKIYGAPAPRFLSALYQPVQIDQEESHVLQVLTYARALGITTPAPKNMSLFLSEEEKKLVSFERTLVPGKMTLPILGVQISARRPKQRWSLEQWKEFITLLLPHARIRLLWSPGSNKNPQHPGDDQLAKELSSIFPKDTLLVKPTTNLRSLMIAFSSCNLIVGSDGGAMHIAAALNIPTLTLFGDINPDIWKPYSNMSHVMKSPTDALASLPPQEVAQKTRALL